MSAYITIAKGSYRNFNVTGQTFQLVADFKEQGTDGAGYVTVKNNGAFPGMPEVVRIKVSSMQDVIPASAADCATTSIEANYDAPKRKEKPMQLETDEQAIRLA